MDGDSFAGRYHHTDGYPTGVGQLFAERARDADDLEAFLAYIVDEHPAGWSSLWDDRCYCHWEGREERAISDPIRDCDLFIEWAYAIDAGARMLGVWVHVEDPSSTDDDHSYSGRLVTVVPLDSEIDWEAIQRRGDAIHEAAYDAVSGRVRP